MHSQIQHGLGGPYIILLQTLCLSHAEALLFPVLDSAGQSRGRPPCRDIGMLSKLSRHWAVLPGVVSGRRVLKTGGRQMPLLEKRQQRKAKFRCLPRGPDCIPLGYECWAGEGELGVDLHDTGMDFVHLTPRTDWSNSCTPPMLSVQPPESSPGGQQYPSASESPSRAAPTNPQKGRWTCAREIVGKCEGSPGTGPEYQDGKEQSSLETSKVLHEILRELKMILGGVNSLSLNSAVSRRSTSTVDDGADPNTVDDGADPNAVVGRADPNAVDANTFQTYCIEGIVAVLGSMLLGMVLCCVLHVWRKRRKRLAASRTS